MLVLTRKRSEKIQIGDDIVIKVIRTGRSAVKIGIEAPDSVRVLRAELCQDGTERSPAEAGAAGPSEFSEGEDEEAELLARCSDQFPLPHIL